MNQDQALEILKKGHSVFLTGSPGAGKTFLLNRFIKHLRSKKIAVAVTASTGIAATHMNGITLHSWSGLGIKQRMSDQEIKHLMKKRYLVKRIRRTKVLIIDEVSMLNAAQFDAVDKICQYFKTSFLPFGGIQVVLSGDFFQLPPIEKNREVVEFITESAAWENLKIKVCYLQGQFRHNDEKLAALLENIRENNIEASKNILAGRSVAPVAAGTTTKLYTHNVDVDFINAQELAKINEKEFHYEMTSSGQPVVVDILKKSCLSPEKLTLKKGAQVMFIKNNFDEGYVNGTQGTVTDFDVMGMPIVKTLSGAKILVDKASWKIEEDDKPIAQIQQIPLCLAWAITVHKSQGMNLDAAEIDLSKCFVKGMGYVALSRLRSFDGLHVIGVNDMAFTVHEKAVQLDGQFRQMSRGSLAMLQKEGSVPVFFDNGEKLPAYNVEEVRKTQRQAYLPWNEEQDNKLKQLFTENSHITELAEIFNRTKGAIRSRLKKLGFLETLK